MICYAERGESVDAMQTISMWVKELPKRGKYTFTLQEVVEQFPNLTKDRIYQELSRQIAKKLVKSVWRGFYAIVLHEYGLNSDIPPSEYIDQLMGYLGKRYYVALLSAASMHGSSHQSPQSYMIMIEGGSLRSSAKNGVLLDFYTRKNVPQKYIEHAISRSGTISFSGKELTAIDLVARMNSIGGLNRVAEVLEGLAEEGLEFEKVEADFFKLSSAACIQRLGYLLDEELGYREVAAVLYSCAMEAGIQFKHTPLVPLANQTGGSYGTQQKWKIIVNREVEVG